MWTAWYACRNVFSTDEPPAASSFGRENGHLLPRGQVVRTTGIQGRSQARPELCVCLGGHAAAGDGCRLAAACVRSAVPSYAQDRRTLAELLDGVYKRAGGRTRKRAAKLRFCELWYEAHDRVDARSKSLLASAVTVAHISPKHIAYLFTGIGLLGPGWKSIMGDCRCTLSASTSFLPVDARERYADSAAGTALVTRQDRSTMTSVDPHQVRQPKVRRWTVAVRPLPLCLAARDSAAADGSSCI
jgi:hypothetical protein